MYSYPSPGWTGTPILTFNNLLPIYVKFNTKQDLLNYFGVSNYPESIPTNWCIRWLGYITVPSSGTWTFFITHSHGINLWVNGKLLMSNKTIGIDSNDIILTENTKYIWQLDTKYNENSGDLYPFYMVTYWKGPTVPQPTVVPSSAFFFDQNNPPPTNFPIDL